jgi:hypothetical protein
MQSALSEPFSRREWMIWVVACVLVNHAVQILDTRSIATFLTDAASLNLIYWFAGYVIVYRLLLSQPDRSIDKTDLLIGLLVFGSACVTGLVGYRLGIGLVATILGLYMILRRSNDRHMQASGAVVLALSGNLVWAPIIFQLIAPELLLADAKLVGSLLHAVQPEIIRNGISFQGAGDHVISLVGACSSFTNMSIALLAVAAMTMLIRSDWRRGDLLVGLVACLVMIAINAVRLSLLASSADRYVYWHDGMGATWLALIQTCAIGLVAYFGAIRAGGTK